MKSLLILAAVLHLGVLQEIPEPFQVPGLCTETGPDQGTCGNYNVRWFFNPDDGQCKEFMYSGCGGNKNNFNSKEDCEKMCIGQGAVQVIQRKTSANDDGRVNTDVAVESNAAPVETEKTASETIDYTQTPDEKESAKIEEKDEEDDDDDGLNDGEEDDELIRKYLNIGGELDAEDNEMIKEAMAAYEVTVLKPVDDETHGEDQANEETKTQGQEEKQNPTEGSATNQSSGNKNDLDEQMTNDKSGEHTQAGSEEDEDDDDGFLEDNGKEVESFLGHIGSSVSAEDREMILEGIAAFGATGLKEVEELEDGMEIVPFAGEEAVQAANNADGTTKVTDVSAEMRNAQTEVKEAQLAIENVQEAINPIEPVHEDTGNGKDEDENDDDDDAPDGIDLDVEYPALRGLISAEDRQILTEAMNAYDVVEAVTDGRKITEEIVTKLPANFEELKEMQQALKIASAPKSITSETQETADVIDRIPVEESGFVDMNDDIDANNENDDVAEDDPVDEIMHHEKDAIFNRGKIDPEDRFMLSELVSQFDVAVMEKKDIDQVKDIRTSEDKSDENKQHFNPYENLLTSPVGDGLLPPRCTMLAETGPCRARKLKWFFDMETGKCSTFIYGGCQGNGNRFRSRGRCMKSCLGSRRPQNNKPREAPENQGAASVEAPTRGPTQKITFMMPFIKDQVTNKRDFAPMPMRIDVPPPSLSIRNIRERVSNAFTTLSEGLGRPQEPIIPESETNIDELRPPFSPLRFMLLRALTRPRGIQAKLARPPTPTLPPPRQRLPFGPRIRIMLPRPRPAQVPMLHTQKPIPNLLQVRSLPIPTRPMQMAMMNRMPSFDIAEHLNQAEQESENGYSVFNPKIKHMKKIQSANHDNRHLNNVSPNNKFTLLQVFVNKPNGAQSPVNTIKIPRQPPRVPTVLNKPPPPPPLTKSKPYSHMMNQASKNLLPPYPMFYPMMHSHRMHPMPFMHSPFVPPHHHHDPFPGPFNQYSRFGPSPFNAPPRPFSPPRTPPSDRFTRLRRPRPVVIVTGHEDTEDEKSRNSCLVPLAPGHCKSYQTKWYYNRDSNKCEIFYFTGCGGNANKFETWEQCADLCIDTHGGAKTTSPAWATEELTTTELDEDEDKRPDTIIVTSTVFPKTEAEAKVAAEEALVGVEDPPSVEELRTTTETPEVEAKQTNEQETQHFEGVTKETNGISKEYIILLVVMAMVAVAVVVILTLSIVHICRRSPTSKKEKALEDVINQHLYGEFPKVVHTIKSTTESAGKPQA